MRSNGKNCYLALADFYISNRVLYLNYKPNKQTNKHDTPTF